MLSFRRIFPIFFIGAASAVSLAGPPSFRLPAVTYAANDDNFHQEQYRDLLADTKRLLPEAIQTVLRSKLLSKSLGLHSDFQFRYPIRVEIKVIPETSLYHGLEGTAGWRQVDGQWVHVLALNIDAYVQNPKEDVNVLISHEMAHIVLADFMGAQGSESVPMWLNEGLAQSVTPEGRSRVRDLSRNLWWSDAMLLPCQLDAPVDAFAHGEGNYQCYPEYYLAVQRLNQMGGPDAIGHLIRGLRDNQRIAEVFKSATRKDYASFQADVDTFTADVITDRKPIP